MPVALRLSQFVLMVVAASLQWALAQTPAQNQPPSATPPPAAAPPPAVAPAAKSQGETGLAAVYSDKLNGRKTASGQVYNRDQLTAAHKTLPFGTQVKVTNTKNAKSVVVRINDRGPTQADRVLDLSPKAASALGIKSKGMAEVSLEVVGEAPAKAAKK